MQINITLDTLAIEKMVEEIWREILKIDNISESDSYFDIGGTSLNAARMLGEICKRTQLTLNFSKFYLSPYLRTVINLVLEAKG